MGLSVWGSETPGSQRPTQEAGLFKNAVKRMHTFVPLFYMAKTASLEMVWVGNIPVKSMLHPDFPPYFKEGKKSLEIKKSFLAFLIRFPVFLLFIGNTH